MSKILIQRTFIILLFFNSNIYCQLDGRGGGLISFISDRDGTNEIYLMNADGSYQTQVTNNDAFNFSLSWSNDGIRLAFCSTLNGGIEIYIMDVIDITTALFSAPVRITNNTIMDSSPTWSPNDSHLAFDSQVNGISGIYIMNLANGNMSLLNTSPTGGYQPSWSPVDDRIAFSSEQGIHTIKTDGSELLQLTNIPSLVPQYSPGGEQIAYVAGNVDEDIFIINSDGTGNHRITTSPENDFVPSWSPGGNRLVYEGSVSGVDQICVIDTNGSNYQQLTNIGVNRGPAWYPIADPNPVINSENILSEFKLFQNYPNPFNPTTSIKYTINSKQFVNITVYNILGNKIATLVDEEKSSGLYEVQFYGTGISSGVYLYKLQVGDPYSGSGGNCVQSKKMVLIK